MSADKIYYSPLPDIDLPETSCWHFIFDRPNQQPYGRAVYVDCLNDREIRFQELKSLTKRLAYGLINRANLIQDDVILLFSPNTFLYPAFVQGAQAATLCVSLANPAYQFRELVHHIKDSCPKVLVVGEPVFGVARKAAVECGIFDCNIYIMEEKDHGKFKSIWSLVGEEELEPRRLSPQEARERTAFICYSSGTTGKTKGVETTHYNLTSVVSQKMAQDPTVLDEGEKWLAILPLYHIYGGLFFIFLSPCCGAITFILPKFEPELWLKSIQKYRITRGNIVPPIAIFLAKHPAIEKYDLSSIKGWDCGAAPLSGSIADLVEQRTGIPFREGYGMTETTCVICSTPRGKAKRGTVGILAPNMKVKFVNGELFVKGPNIMKGYLRNPKANAETFTKDGWMRTGDICRIDEDGDMFVVERIKELIKYKGFQVPPAELESVLLTHPDVADAAVLGIYDPEQATELPRAYVVRSASAIGKKNVDVDLVQWVAGRVSDHKRLREGVHFVDAIPKNPSGKILRRVLKDQARLKADTKL